MAEPKPRRRLTALAGAHECIEVEHCDSFFGAAYGLSGRWLQSIAHGPGVGLPRRWSNEPTTRCSDVVERWSAIAKSLTRFTITSTRLRLDVPLGSDRPCSTGEPVLNTREVEMLVPCPLLPPLSVVLAIEVPLVIAAILMPAIVTAWGAWAVLRWALDRRRAALERVEDPPTTEWPTYESTSGGAHGGRSAARREWSSSLPLPILGASSILVAVAAMALTWPTLGRADSAGPQPQSPPASSAGASMEPQSSSGSASSGTGPSGGLPGTAKGAAGPVEIVGTGFAQDGQYVEGVAVVRVNDPKAVGEYITVSMNFLDQAGSILATEGHVEQAWWAGQELALPISTELHEGEAVRVDASVSISDYGDSEEPRGPLAPMKSKQVMASGGEVIAVFEFTNGTSKAVADLRVGIACYDSAGTIVGGNSSYPDPVAPGRTIRIESEIRTSAEPSSCTAYPSF